MKYLLILSLFLIGCSDDKSFTVSQTDIIMQAFKSYDRRIQDIEHEVLIMKAQKQPKNGQPTMDLDECVWFEKGLDTHAGASYTIPITGKYKYRTWDNESKWYENYLQSGSRIYKAIEVIRDTCPKYATIDKKGL